MTNGTKKRNGKRIKEARVGSKGAKVVFSCVYFRTMWVFFSFDFFPLLLFLTNLEGVEKQYIPYNRKRKKKKKRCEKKTNWGSNHME